MGIILFVYFSQSLINLANTLWDRQYYFAVESGGIVATLIYVLIFLFCIIVAKKPMSENIDNTMFYVLIAGFVCYLERYIGALAAERISFYFMFSQIILLPNVLKNGKIEEKDKVAVEMIIIALCVMLYTYRLIGSDLIPLKFFWEVY